MKKGVLITFEGPEGCGKSTQSALLGKYLKSLGIKVVLSLEPGGTKIGKEIRKIILNTEGNLASNSELFLFAADRAQHIEEVIKPALEQGSIVISDRFIDSTIAYQIGARKLPEELVRYVNAISSNGVIPGLTFLLDIAPAIGLPRSIAANVDKTRIKKTDRFENEKMAFHDEVRKMYLEIAANDPDRVKVIDTEKQDITTVQEQIRKLTKEFISD